MPTIAWGSINVWAVLTAGFATFMLGGLWYTVLFGKLWQRLQGYTDEKLKAMHTRRPPPVFFGTLLASYMLVALVVAWLCPAVGATTAAGGALFGLLLWIGPHAAIAMTNHIASDKPMAAYGLDGLFSLIYLPMIGAIVAAWR